MCLDVYIEIVKGLSCAKVSLSAHRLLEGL